MTDKLIRIVVSILILTSIVLMIVSDSGAAVVRGKVTSLLGNVIEINIGSGKGVRVGDSGRVYYTVMVDNIERPVYIARFKITQLSANSSIAQIEEKTVDIMVGFLAEATVKEGELEIGSEPSGAKVYLDGNEMGETPLILSDIWLGQHTVRVVKDGYEPHEEQVEIKGADRKTVTASLRRMVGEVLISTEPSGANIYIEGRPVGTSPYEARDLPPGTYRLRAVKEGYVTWEGILSVRSGRRVEIPIELKVKAGELVIHTDPSGANVSIDGKPVGISPYEGKALSPGTFRVRIVKEGYEPWETEVVVEIEKRVEVRAYLKPMEGNLEILSEPAGAKVSIDGKEIGETPLTVSRIRLGQHLIRIVKEEYFPYEEGVEVKGTERKTVQASLKRMAGELLVSTEPEDASIYIDGKPVGTSPYEGKALSPGTHKVKIIKEGYEVWERDVAVGVGKRVEVLTKLSEKKREVGQAPTPTKPGIPREKEAKEIPKASKSADLAKKSCEAPVWNVGDRWMYRKKTGEGWTQEVIDFKEDLFILRVSGQQELEAFDRKTMNQTFLIGKDGRKVSNVDNPFKRLFDFPLSAGKKWSYSTRSKVAIPGSSTIEVVLSNEFKVESVEEVKTPAGTFMAYRIFYKQKVMSSMHKGAAGKDEGWVRYWYSQDAKMWVKREFEKSPFWPDTFRDAELISYELK